MSFREYKNCSKHVKQFYKELRSNQSVDKVKELLNRYCTKFNRELTIWEVADHLRRLVDRSDPDLDLPNIVHGLQSAMYAKECGEDDWMILLCLIHDFGKIIYLWGNDQDGTSQNKQWGMVGDTYVVGCALPNTLVLPEYNILSPDRDNPLYNTANGMYKQNCGFDKCLLSFGHDEYLYQMLKHNKTGLPPEALYIIRYHSFYPWHQKQEYGHLANEYDHQMLPLLKRFNKYDLYSKSDKQYDLEELKPYFDSLIKKYLPDKLYW